MFTVYRNVRNRFIKCETGPLSRVYCLQKRRNRFIKCETGPLSCVYCYRNVEIVL